MSVTTLLTLAHVETVAALRLTQETTPDPAGTPGVPTMRPDLEVTDVSPGLLGFLAIFVVAVAAIFLMLSLTKKLRKLNHTAGADTQASAVFSDGPAAPRPAGTDSAGTDPASTDPAGPDAPGADGTRSGG